MFAPALRSQAHIFIYVVTCEAIQSITKTLEAELTQHKNEREHSTPPKGGRAGDLIHSNVSIVRPTSHTDKCITLCITPSIELSPAVGQINNKNALILGA